MFPVRAAPSFRSGLLLRLQPYTPVVHPTSSRRGTEFVVIPLTGAVSLQNAHKQESTAVANEVVWLSSGSGSAVTLKSVDGVPSTALLVVFDTPLNRKKELPHFQHFALPALKPFKVPTLTGSASMVLYSGATGRLDTLYDFGLEKGDHFTFNFENDSVRLEVIKVDMAEVNGIDRKRITFSEPGDISMVGIMNEVWIEGVGSIHGPLYPAAPRMFMTEFTDALDLTCARMAGGEVIWKNSNYDDCFVNNILSAQTDRTDAPFSVYPNPFEQEIYLDGPFMGGSGAHVNVYDMQGRRVYSSQLPVGKRQLSLNGLGKGVYLLEIAWKGESYFQKIVK
jgi:hypothetical protein